MIAFKTQGYNYNPSILTLASHDKVYIVDIIKFLDNKQLDEALVEILTQTESTIIGITFRWEFETLSEFCPYMKFWRKIPRFVDVDREFQRIHNTTK